jgi:hypothetical protein
MTATTTWTERTEQVAFHGSRTAVAPLSWAQKDIFPRVWTPSPGASYFNVFFWLPVPADREIADVLTAVRHAMTVCEALRTRYSLDPDGTPRQEVHDSGRLDVSILETAEKLEDADAEQLQYELGRQTFDHATSWPARFTVAVSDGRPAYLLAVVSHLSIDAGGRLRLRDILTEALSEGPPPAADPAAGPAEVPQMIERARWEASEEGRKRSARSLRGWSDLVRRLPTVTAFAAKPDGTPPGDPVEPRRPLFELTSPAASRAAAILAARHAVGTPAVFLAASASLVAALSGHREIALGTMSANRTSPADQALVGMLAQSSIVAVDTEGTSFGQVARQAQTSVLRGVGIARFDPADWLSLNEDFKQRGENLAPDGLHNDARELAAGPAAPGTATGPADVVGPGALLPESRMVLLGNIVEHVLHFNMTLFGDDECVRWRLWVDRWYVVAPEASDLLLALEALLVSAAEGEDGESPVEWLRRRLSGAGEAATRE